MKSRVGIFVALCAGATGCNQILDVDGYTFDRDPCPPVEACEGGQLYFYASGEVGLTRVHDGNVLEGFDFDGTDATVCGRPDRIAPDGTRGIDNEVGPFAPLLLETMPMGFETAARSSILASGSVAVIELDNVDNLVNDNCVSVRTRFGVPPPGSAADYLDTDQDSYLDHGVLLDYRGVQDMDPTACIVDGRLHIRFAGMITTPVFGQDVSVTGGRMRLDVSEQGLDNGVFGAVITTQEGLRLLRNLGLPDDAMIAALAETLADLDPVDGRCTSLSAAFLIGYVDARRGVLVP